jgi:hypothetical protein
MRIWIVIKSANAHHLTVSGGEKQSLARRAEPVCAGNPLVAQTPYEPVTLMRTFCAQSIKSV